MKAPDRIDAAQHALVQVLSHPVTWLPFVPIAAAYAFIGLPWWLCLGLALVVLAAVGRVWTRRWPVLVERARTGLLQSYRDQENTGLNARLQHLAAALAQLPTRRLLYDLGEAAEIKLAIEKRLFADGVISPHEEEVGEMVSDSLQTMWQEAEKFPLMERSQWLDATVRVEKALESLRRVFEQIDLILDPIPESLRLPAETDALGRARERLDERLEQARGVRRHLERGAAADSLESAPPVPTPMPGPSARKQATTEN